MATRKKASGRTPSRGGGRTIFLNKGPHRMCNDRYKHLHDPYCTPLRYAKGYGPKGLQGWCCSSIGSVSPPQIGLNI